MLGAISGLVSSAVTAGVQIVEKSIGEMVNIVEEGAETIIETVKNIGEGSEAADQAVLFSTNSAMIMGDAQENPPDLDAPSTHLTEDLSILNDRLGLTGDQLDSVGTHVEQLRRMMGNFDLDDFTQSMNQFGGATRNHGSGAG